MLRIVRFLLLVTVCYFVLLGACSLWCGSLRRAFAFLEGSSILIDCDEINLGEVESEDAVTVPIPIANISSHPLRVIGIRGSCDCVVTDELPLLVQPGEHRDLSITLSASKHAIGDFMNRVILYTDCERNRLLTVGIRGTIVQAAEGADGDGK